MIRYNCLQCGSPMESPSELQGASETCSVCAAANWVPQMVRIDPSGEINPSVGLREFVPDETVEGIKPDTASLPTDEPPGLGFIIAAYVGRQFVWFLEGSGITLHLWAAWRIGCHSGLGWGILSLFFPVFASIWLCIIEIANDCWIYATTIFVYLGLVILVGVMGWIMAGYVFLKSLRNLG